MPTQSMIKSQALEKLWNLNTEYEALKSGIEDQKVLLAALKQHQDLLEAVVNLTDNPTTQDNKFGDYDDARAVAELRELFRKLQPILAS